MADTPASRVVLIYDGADISQDIASDLLSFDFTDNSSDQADDLQIVLKDREHLWRGPWFPEKGATLEASILPAFGGGTLYCGTFEIDDVDIAGPPSTMTIKAVSTGISSKLRQEKHTSAWEDTTLEEIAGELAGNSDFQLFYEAPEKSYQRVDQREESDLAFLSRITEEAGLSLKVADRRVVIFDEQEYENRDSVAAYHVEGGQVVSYSARSKTREVYKSAKVSYRDPVANELIEFEYAADPEPPVGQVLEIRKRVESIDQARELARRELRNKNRHESQASITCPGDPRLQAGQNIDLDGLGILSGKYHIEQARHTVNDQGGFTTRATCHRVLSYE